VSRKQWIALVVLVPVVLLGALGIRQLVQSDDETPPALEPIPGLQLESADDATVFTWNYVIPEGTASRINAGERVEIVPAELTVAIGDTIRIVNDDIVDHVVGVFYVGSGETLTQRFQSAGVLEGECSVHPSGAFTLTVLDA
jgi:plastocyanin